MNWGDKKKLKAVTVWRTVLNQLKSRVSKQSGVSSQTDMAMKELIKRFERLGKAKKCRPRRESGKFITWPYWCR
ncbi:unnamed protein product [Callosobruchus maculatus]|uniref:Uncharacterized protein n=2 Tax=Callosobruchus maculatus TaxID=64391 RepID=A0A653BJS8_CALMS|nr:unnamed protein product [Callosobruchus maculatus]